MEIWQKTKSKLIAVWRIITAYGVFLALLGLFFLKKLFWLTKKIKVNSDFIINKIDRLMDKIDGKEIGEVSRIYLIELAMRNLKSKKMRAVVTIGGMALGVGAVVFLVSLGYGLERLVISRVARLDELKMIDVGMGEVATSKMNDAVMDKIVKMEGVSEVIPAVSMVAKVKYKNSVVDMMSIGVDEKYIKAVGAKILTGNNLKDKKDDGVGIISDEGEVAGWNQEVVTAVLGTLVEKGLTAFNVRPEKLVPIWNECSRESEMLGYITRQEGGYFGEKRWGERYYVGDDRGVVGQNKKGSEQYSVWIRTKAPLWKEEKKGVVVPVFGGNSYQQWEIGCVAQTDVEEGEKLKGFDNLDDYLSGKEEQIVDGRILGLTTTATASATAVATDSAIETNLFETVVATDSAGVEWVELKKTDQADNKQKQLSFDGLPEGEAFISSGMLRVFGLNKDKVIGEKFGVSFIIPDGLVPGVTGRLQSEQTDYQVAGVIDDESSNYFYFHLGDAKKLGVRNYSQLKVVGKSQEVIPGVRKEIETSGLRTVSTLDTVAEIEKLFRTLRLVLGLLGTIALAVAALGMFNTMTVSLLERTREVGVMKAMGMLSNDVRELFLAESMIMGVGGGVCGVLLGVVGGKLVSILLTSVSVIKGQGAMDISYVPWFFVSFILGVSFMVGIMTGWYPSRRARQISALNALRYE